MKSMLLLLVHLIVSVVKLAGPGARGLLAESLLLKHQLLVVNRGRKRAPNLTFFDRLFLGLGCLLIYPGRIRRIAVIVSPASLFKFHKALMRRKYRHLFSSTGTRRKPGPKGPSEAVISAIVEMKQRNPRYGCPRIAEQISKAFGIVINKDVVRQRSRQALQAHGWWWSVMANAAGSHERQSMERRLILL